MNSKEFRRVFNEIANEFGFEKAFGGWFKESNECIAVLDLQKSNFGDYYELNIKIFVQFMFDSTYEKNKELVRKKIGDVFTRQPDNFKDTLDFDVNMEDNNRRNKLNELFSTFIRPFTDKALSRKGLLELESQKKIYLLPAVKADLEARSSKS